MPADEHFEAREWGNGRIAGTPINGDGLTDLEVRIGQAFAEIPTQAELDTALESVEKTADLGTSGHAAGIGTQNVFGSHNQFQGRVRFGDTPDNPRVRWKSSQGLTVTAGSTSDHVSHLMQSILLGDWDPSLDPDGIDPGFAWGLNVYATTGTAAGDGANVAVYFGATIETAIRTPAGSTLDLVIGLQAETSFASTFAGATVTDMRALDVKGPYRKDGATNGIATNAYGIYLHKVSAAAIGATTAYSLYTEGGSNRIGGATEIRATDDAAQVPLTVRQYPGATGRVQTWQNGGGADIGGVTYLGGINMQSQISAYAGNPNQSGIGIYNDSGTSRAALLLGSSADAVLYRHAAGVLGIPDNHTIKVGATSGLKIGSATTEKIGFFGHAAAVQQTLPAAATDAATTQTLANSLRTAMLNLGLAA